MPLYVAAALWEAPGNPANEGSVINFAFNESDMKERDSVFNFAFQQLEGDHITWYIVPNLHRQRFFLIKKNKSRWLGAVLPFQACGQEYAGPTSSIQVTFQCCAKSLHQLAVSSLLRRDLFRFESFNIDTKWSLSLHLIILSPRWWYIIDKPRHLR